MSITRISVPPYEDEFVSVLALQEGDVFMPKAERNGYGVRTSGGWVWLSVDAGLTSYIDSEIDTPAASFCKRVTARPDLRCTVNIEANE